MHSYITAIATAVPAYKRPQVETAALISQLMCLDEQKQKQLTRAFANSSIDYRYSVVADYMQAPADFTFFSGANNFEPFPTTAQRMQLYQQEALPLALQAVKKCALVEKDFSLQSITHLITVSCTGMYSPGLDIELVQHLPLLTTTRRTCINFMGCYGTFNGLKVADQICRATPDAKVLVVSVELCSLHLQKQPSMDNIIGALLFGDGAGAAIVQAQPAKGINLALTDFYCDLVPETNEQMTWQIGDTGFAMALSAYIPKSLSSGIASFCHRLLAHNQYSLKDIHLYAIHPGGKKILQACEEALGLSKSANRFAYEILKNYGNMSSATILFILEAILAAMQPTDDGKNIMGIAFGPGLTLESMLLRVTTG